VETITAIIQVVEAVDRIPPEYEEHTFFSSQDLWKLESIYDKKLCNVCRILAQDPYYYGNHLRHYFPYLEIINEDQIRANIHPHCRCILTRVTAYERMR